MKNKKLITVAVFLPLLSYMLFSCKKSAKVPAPIVYDSIVVKKQIPMFETNDTTLPFADVKVSFIYPEEFGSKEDLARLQQIFIGTFFRTCNSTLSLRKLRWRLSLHTWRNTGHWQRATTKRRRDLRR